MSAACAPWPSRVGKATLLTSNGLVSEPVAWQIVILKPVSVGVGVGEVSVGEGDVSVGDGDVSVGVGDGVGATQPLIQMTSPFTSQFCPG